MKCIHCDNEARAVCQFCGRAVCQDHLREQTFFSGYSTKMGWWTANKSAVRIDDAVWCGRCHPEHLSTG
ncbi:MAG: hypothetical protein ACYC35_11145 [Pirellulales bacterium]|jgi:hypothetical protein